MIQPERTIDFIGASDEDVAHLRLLIRKARARLDASWRWGSEDRADLVVVDPTSVPGEQAMQRTLARGRPCAVIWRGEALPPEGLVLPVPFRDQAVIALLNSIGDRDAPPMPLIMAGEDFFVMDLGEEEAAAATVDEGLLAALPDFDAQIAERTQLASAIEDAESLFRRDPLADSLQVLLPDAMDQSAAVDYVARANARAQARAQAAGGLHQDDTARFDAPNIQPSHRAAPPPDDRSFPLRDYLAEGLLMHPARLHLLGLPALVLDPKEGVYHAEGLLPDLELLALQSIRRADWIPLTTAELEAVRAAVPAKPIARLQWMERLLALNGQLAPHLDPGGTYRLVKWLELTADYPHHAKVAQQMLKPMRLHEIAAAAKAPMGEVFDVVNAYDAIGFLEWTPRERLQGGPA